MLSFVRRSGRLDDRLQRAWDNYADTYLLDITTGNLLDVREGVTLNRNFVAQHWGNDNPLIVEIGTGQGENVVAAAAAHPETNFLALEVYDPGVAHTLLLRASKGCPTSEWHRSTRLNCLKVTEPRHLWLRYGRSSPIRGPREAP